MHLSILLDMAADALDDRVVVSDDGGQLTATQLRDGARAIAHRWTTEAPAESPAVGASGGASGGAAGDEVGRTVFVGVNSRAVPLTLFAAALSGTAFTPLNYRLTDAELQRVAERAAPGVAVVDDDMVSRIEGVAGLRIMTTSELLAAAADAEASAAGAALPEIPDPDAIGVLLFTSGTTGEPKAAVLRHTHLASYIMSTLDFASADEAEAGLVSVPPYHIAGISAILSSLFTGRRIVYLASFTPAGWADAVADHAVTHAMVVPTMLGRVLDVLDERGAALPTLRHLAYGGGRMPVDVIERAVNRLPDVDFVNAYGLTETSSTISVLAPDDHRAALASTDPAVRARLGSAGRPHGSIEVTVRDEDGTEVPNGTPGEIWVRGDQVSGEYVGKASRAVDGWFPTNDSGMLDEAGYLFVSGRLDDVIVRGGENISPGEIEDVLREHPAVADVAVFGTPSHEWGETVAAVVVLAEGAESPDPDTLRALVRERLRSTKVPEIVEYRSELPYSETGKLLRRVLRAELDPS